MDDSMARENTLNEAEGEKHLNARFPRPKGKWYDTIQARMDKLEPIADSIEYLLGLWSKHVDRALRDNAESTVAKFRADRSQLGITGRFPSMAVFGKSSEHLEGMRTALGELQRKISEARIEEKTRREEGLRYNALKADYHSLQESMEATVSGHEERLAGTLGVVQRQGYFGQFVMQQKDPEGRLIATIATPQSLSGTVLYIDCSGDRGGKVAQGSFGSIYLGRTGSDDLYAVKLPVSGRLEDNELEREGEIWYALQTPLPHPNILEFCGTCVLGAGMFKGLLSRWVVGGRSWKDSLLDFKEEWHLEFMEGIASAIVHMHEKAIIHGDIKLDNVIITPAPHRPLLCDFGMSVRRTLDSTRDSVKGCGSGAHVSPEVHHHIPKTVGSDTWAFGILILHALSRKIPFEDRLLDIPSDQVLLEYYKLFIVLDQRPRMPDDLTPIGKQAWHVALACLHNLDRARPRMQDVCEAIRDIIGCRVADLEARLERWKVEAQTAEQNEPA